MLLIRIGEAIVLGLFCGLFFGLIGSVIGAFVIGLTLGILYSINILQEEHLEGYLAGGTIICGMISMIIGGIYGVREPFREEAERRQKEEAARRKEQEGYYKQMVILCEGSLALFESMPLHLDSAEKWLDQAQADFAESAFAPFWDSVENAANWLALFDEGVRQIKDKSSCYTALIGQYKHTPPPFPLVPRSVEKLSVGMATAERMRAIVRTAQRNFQFAMIYEQRKTNQILVAGFKTLAEALEYMTRQITASLDSLADSVNTSLHAIESQLDGIAAMSEQHHYEMMEQVSEVAERERAIVKKLDNIQHRRRL